MAKTTKKEQPTDSLTNAQRELLKLFSLKLTAAEMKLLKERLNEYLDEITQMQLDKCVASGKYALGRKLTKEHLRTPYQ